MFRFTIPVDDELHVVSCTGDPVAVAATDPTGYEVEFWAEHDDEALASRAFRVFGTGHPLPEGARWVGTCPRTRAGLVWHLYEIAEAEGG